MTRNEVHWSAAGPGPPTALEAAFTALLPSIILQRRIDKDRARDAQQLLESYLHVNIHVLPIVYAAGRDCNAGPLRIRPDLLICHREADSAHETEVPRTIPQSGRVSPGPLPKTDRLAQEITETDRDL